MTDLPPPAVSSPGSVGVDEPPSHYGLPRRRVVLTIAWLWNAWWLTGILIYSIMIGKYGIGQSLGLDAFCLFCIALAVAVADLWHVRTRYRMRRKTGHWPSKVALSEELWRRRDGRRAKARQATSAMTRVPRGVTETAKVASQAVSSHIEQAHADRVRRTEEEAAVAVGRRAQLEPVAQTVAAEATRRFQQQQGIGTLDAAHVRVKYYLDEASRQQDVADLEAAGWYQQVDSTLRYTIARDGFTVVIWRHPF
jgi:hypothetical protein